MYFQNMFKMLQNKNIRNYIYALNKSDVYLSDFVKNNELHLIFTGVHFNSINIHRIDAIKYGYRK